MSKLGDKIDKLGQQTGSTMGFGMATRKNATNPAMVLLGRGTLDDLKKKATVQDSAVDAFLVELGEWPGDALDKATEALKDKLWGVRIAQLDAEQAARLKALGCDFAVLDLGDTPASVLNDEEFGKYLAIGPGLDEDTARAVHELPLDGVLYTPQDKLFPLTLRSLFELQKARSYVDRPIILAAPASVGQAELETLRNAGLAGLAADATAKKELAATREAILNLPKPKPPKKGQALALLPQYAQNDAAQHEHEHEEPDEDDRGENF
ncbi:MAG: hypothetical protein FJ312_02530 [SAR202 cluster bacterium]|nr:hypothetical protein [SAR202 cluster bacterium]